jgi:hypothetical protein
MKTVDEIRDKINELDIELQQEIDNLYGCKENNMYSEIPRLDKNIEILTNKIYILKWVLNKNN